jgi:predicted DsbA family dithiol-disulfide isomerase
LPWCHLGKRRFDAAVAAWSVYGGNLAPLRRIDLRLRASTRRRLAAWVGDAERVAAVHAELQRQGEASGIDFQFDLIRRMPNTRRSHLLIGHAARSGLQAAVKDRIMRAYFEEGCDVGDTEELVRLAAEVGLAERAARSALVLRSGQDGVIAAERHAGVLGITGVPTFVFDGQYTVSGAQDVGTLARIFDQVTDFAASRDVAS